MGLCKLSFIFLTVASSGCSFFSRNTSDGELERIAKDVLDKKEGIDIQVKPISEKDNK